jgi:hydrogenase maturation protein HypF
MPRLRIEVQGVVQGVGFRPTVYRLALAQGLTGSVWNHARGVTIEAQGDAAHLEAFVRALREEVPPPARVAKLASTEIPEHAGPPGFQILASQEGGSVRPVVPPDLAVCAACAEEMDTPGERRYRYPFTNCSFCGPRYSIITQLPYDRPQTAMQSFPLCPACALEYGDPGDRRFHAQPIACPVCGPRLSLRSYDGTLLAEGEEAMQAAVVALKTDQVVALKGLGGYQLMVDATSDEAVRCLRDRKQREEKPFAVMFPDMASLEAACEVSEAERALLASPEAPILLLRRKPGTQVNEGIAPGNPRLGAFLPYTPLHRLLLAVVDRPLVCTSGNLSDEPMAFEDAEALDRLGTLADVFLAHDRPILRPVDDSVLRVDGDGPTLLRRARGYAPLAVPLAGWEDAPTILAFGAQQKATVSLLHEGQLIMSQHLGDLMSTEGADLLARTVEDLLAFFQARPQRLACDLHPDYASTRLAERLALEWNLPLTRVQHHHAHAAACAAEHGLEHAVTALAWDGTGLGSDDTLWGGEALVLKGGTSQRLGHLRPFPLPGGEAAVREPRRSACGLLWALRGPGAPPPALAPAFDGPDWQLLQAMLAKDLHSPLTSSIGRLFDAVAALVTFHGRRGFEGQAAMALEFVAGNRMEPPYDWELQEGVADPSLLLEGILADLDAGQDASFIAARFHASLADLALAWSQLSGLSDVILSGGCFQNALLTGLVQARLTEAGFHVHRHRKFPPNDGSISLGQAVVAARGS